MKDHRVIVTTFKNKARTPRTRVTCACCDEKLDIYFDEEFTEINGVMASNDFWRKLFSQLPK